MKLEKETINKFHTTFPGFGYNVQRGTILTAEVICVETGVIYENAREAARQLYLSDYRVITRVLNDFTKKSCNCHWATTDWALEHPEEMATIREDPAAFTRKRGVGGKQVYCTEAQAWSTIADFAEKFEILPCEIHRVLDKPTRTCGGVHFTTNPDAPVAPQKAKRGKHIVNLTTGEEYPSI